MFAPAESFKKSAYPENHLEACRRAQFMAARCCVLCAACALRFAHQLLCAHAGERAVGGAARVAVAEPFAAGQPDSRHRV